MRASISIVARVQPKMSKGITDLLLLNASIIFFSDWRGTIEMVALINRETIDISPFKKWCKCTHLAAFLSYRQETN